MCLDDDKGGIKAYRWCRVLWGKRGMGAMTFKNAGVWAAQGGGERERVPSVLERRKQWWGCVLQLSPGLFRNLTSCTAKLYCISVLQYSISDC